MRLLLLLLLFLFDRYFEKKKSAVFLVGLYVLLFVILYKSIDSNIRNEAT